MNDSSGAIGCLVGGQATCDMGWLFMPFLGPGGPYFPADGPTQPVLEGATNKQQDQFNKAIKLAENKLKSKKDCAGDFGGKDSALGALDNATYTFGVEYQTDANGGPTAQSDRNIYGRSSPLR